MTLLVLSDSHGRFDKIKEAFDLNRGVLAVLFLGDGLRDVERVDFLHKPVISVRGNCDTFGFFADSLPQEERMVRFGEYNIMLMHGHRFSVKGSLDTAMAYAARRGADILLFGHTHIRYDKYFAEGTELGGEILKKPLRVFNPGSIGAPRESGYSFGLIGIRGKDVLTSHGEL